MYHILFNFRRTNKMLLNTISAKTLVSKLANKAPTTLAIVRGVSSKRDEKGNLLPMADPKEYGEVPDPIEHSWGDERKMIIARLMGDDRYEQKIFYRAEQSTRDYPNLVPMHHLDGKMLCHCEPEHMHAKQWIIRKDGLPKRCECGHWFKGVDVDHEFIC